MMRLRIGIDTGGTFTDFTVLGPAGSTIVKVPSTPDDPSRAILRGLDRILGSLSRHGRGPEDDRRRARSTLLAGMSLVHGTTVGTNALITKRVARTAFVTTSGFEDLIEIGRQNRDSLYDLQADRAEPLVPRALRFGVGERVNVVGPGWADSRKRSTAAAAVQISERVRPEADEMRRLSHRLRKLGVESLAIGFLHSYLDPANEELVAAALRSLAIPVTLSHRISGEYREYERFSTAIANAALQPSVGGYLRRLKAGVTPASLSILQSDGTTATPPAAADEPIRTVLSGPAGGALAAYALARRLGDRKILSFDMGGTSTDVVLIDGGLPRRSMGRIGGLPLRAPTIDVKTVGAGGGSIARRDAAGALRVGPESAGADPGPACYGKGRDPTVTDAHIVLGRLGEEDLLGGEFPVDASRSLKAVGRLARSLRLDIDRAAEGILAVVEGTMERALRTISIEQGKDPRGHALYAFGGAGGLHACALAERMGITRIVVPPGPGAFSATGLAGAAPGVEVVSTLLVPAAEAKLLSACAARLVRRAHARLHDQGVASRSISVALHADLRYAGQSHEITVVYGPSMVRAFHRAHRERYGHDRPGSDVEVVALRARAVSRQTWRNPTLAATRIDEPLSGPDFGGEGSDRDGRLRRRRRSSARLPASARVSSIGEPRSCLAVRREELANHRVVQGPARVTEYSGTTFVAPGWTARSGPFGTLLLTPGREPRRRAGGRERGRA